MSNAPWNSDAAELLYFLQTVNKMKKDFGSSGYSSFSPVLLLFLLFAIYLHVFNYSFRVMDQSQTNRPRSEVISWIVFLAHPSSWMQVFHLLLLTPMMLLSLLYICYRNVTSDLWSPQSSILQKGQNRNVILSLQMSRCSRVPLATFTIQLLCCLHD